MNFVIFLGKLFAEHLLGTTSRMMLYFLQFIWWSDGKIGKEIHKSVQSGVVMGIRWKLHCQVLATHAATSALKVKEKEELKKNTESEIASPVM